MKPIEFYVAGVKFHDLKKAINQVAEGDELTLVPEPTNQYDSNAVKLTFEARIAGELTDVMIGYVPKTRSAEVIAALEAEGPESISAIVKKVNPSSPTYEQLLVRIATIGEDDEEEGEEPESDDF